MAKKMNIFLNCTRNAFLNMPPAIRKAEAKKEVKEEKKVEQKEEKQKEAAKEDK